MKRTVFPVLDLSANNIEVMIYRADCFKSVIPLFPPSQGVWRCWEDTWLGRKAAAQLMMGHGRCSHLMKGHTPVARALWDRGERTELNYSTRVLSPEPASVQRQSADF